MSIPKQTSTEKVKKSKTRKPDKEKVGLKDGTAKTGELIEYDTISVQTKKQKRLSDASIDQVADQEAGTVTKKKKKKASQSDINKYSKVKKGGSENMVVQQAGQE